MTKNLKKNENIFFFNVQLCNYDNLDIFIYNTLYTYSICTSMHVLILRGLLLIEAFYNIVL